MELRNYHTELSTENVLNTLIKYFGILLKKLKNLVGLECVVRMSFRGTVVDGARALMPLELQKEHAIIKARHLAIYTSNVKHHIKMIRT